ncbi:MAG TPA: VanZ family protein [Haploplasma sp.]|nr:VanZ family protein [Haploplasma sp.]
MKKRLPLILVLITTLFIWGNSLLPGSVSSSQSGIITKLLYPLFKNVMSVDTLTTIIRKLAHFTEYAILGLVLAYFYKSKTHKYLLFALLQGVITAIIDESIQLLVPNRAGLLTDVLIDTSGVLFGLLVFYIIYKLLGGNK